MTRPTCATPTPAFPGILKVARFGYDGKGQAVVAHREQALAAFQHFKGETCVLEQKLNARLRSLGGPGARRNGPGDELSDRREPHTARASSTSPSYRRGRPAAMRAGRRTRRASPIGWLHRHPGVEFFVVRRPS
jgi:hypothetical protein